VSAETRWEQLATAVDTLVILMGMRNLEQLVGRVLAGGRDPKTPAAVVMDGTLPRQKVVVAPLDELVGRAREAGLHSPAAVVIGDVVRLRESMAWFEARPLFGKRVLVTRDASQSESMVEALRESGAEAVVVPMIQLAPPETWHEVDARATWTAFSLRRAQDGRSHPGCRHSRPPRAARPLRRGGPGRRDREAPAAPRAPLPVSLQ
jgi:hypothetical protein